MQEVHHIAGEDCFVLKVRVPDAKSLGRLLRQRIGALPTVRSTRTTVVLETVREEQPVPPRDGTGCRRGGRGPCGPEGVPLEVFHE